MLTSTRCNALRSASDRMREQERADLARAHARPAQSRAETQATEITAAGPTLLTLGGDHSITYPLLKAHAAKYGPLALVQFDAHQDTWNPEADDPRRIDHGAFVARAVKEGLIDTKHSIQIGIRTHAPDECGIEIVFGHEVEAGGVQKVVERILRRVGKVRA